MEKKVYNIDMSNAIPTQINFVQGKYILWRCIRDWGKCAKFTVDCALRGHEIRNLDETLFPISNRDKINFPFMRFSRENGKTLKQ